MEADILYAAVFDNEKTVAFRPEMITERENLLGKIYPEGEKLSGILGVYCLEGMESYVYHDVKEEHIVCVL